MKKVIFLTLSVLMFGLFSAGAIACSSSQCSKMATTNECPASLADVCHCSMAKTCHCPVMEACGADFENFCADQMGNRSTMKACVRENRMNFSRQCQGALEGFSHST